MEIYEINYIIYNNLKLFNEVQTNYIYVPVEEDYIGFADYISDDCPKITKVILMSDYPLSYICYLDGYYWEMFNYISSFFIILLVFYFNNQYWNFLKYSENKLEILSSLTQTNLNDNEFICLNFWYDFVIIFIDFINLFLFCCCS